MSEKENTGGSGGSPVVVVESARHKTYRPELPESPTELHHKRSRAPGVPPVNEDLKEATENLDEIRDRKENERAVSTEKHKHGITKKLSSITKKRSSSPEVITLTQVGLETKQDTVTPIPVQVASTTDLVAEKIEAVKENDDDSITEEMPEPRTSDDPKGSTKWFDDEEAGGLPRSESRASRVSRAVRQLFCCGARYDPPSEHAVSPRAYYDPI